MADLFAEDLPTAAVDEPGEDAPLADRLRRRPEGLVRESCRASDGLGVLDPLAGVIPIAAHPVMTFTGTSLDLDRLDDCPFGVTAGSGGASIARPPSTLRSTLPLGFAQCAAARTSRSGARAAIQGMRAANLAAHSTSLVLALYEDGHTSSMPSG